MPAPSKPFYRHIYFWVLFGVIAGVIFGLCFPSRNGEPGLAEQMKPLGEGFISLIKMLIAPIIFFTVVGGIASVGDLKKVGRVGIKALIYFELVTTLAMLLALAAVHGFKPGVGVNYTPSAGEIKKLATFKQRASKARLISCCTSFQKPSSALLPKARFCRFCCFRFCWAWRSLKWAIRPNR